MLLYGRNAVREALRGRRRVLELWGEERALAQLGAPGPRPVIAGRDELTRLCGSNEHQGLVARVGAYPYADPLDLLADEQALVVALDQVQDPQNLGAVCRSAECAGASGVVVTERRGSLVTAAVCRASAGAVEHLPVARAGNLADYLNAAKDRGAWVYGAEAGAPAVYSEPDYSGRVVLVLGHEGAGLRPRVRAACDVLVALPVRGRIESLNVSAAASVLLYEVARRRPGSVS
jgi:23S rRNA (guanosine2251-2'-O)-methyltransferase